MLPKADLHLHQEWSPRLDRVLARRHHRAPFDWGAWRRTLTTEVSPGMARLQHLTRTQPAPADADTDDAFVDRVADALTDSAAVGGCYAEVRFSEETVRRPRFMPLFRRAEQAVRQEFPDFHAEPVASLVMWHERQRLRRAVNACRRAADEGLAGVDLLYVPYAEEADWRVGRAVAAEAASAGLGVTVHAGEFSPANIAAVASIDGVSRIGHATHAAYDPKLLRLLADRGITVEVCLTANLVLGSVPSLEEHPLRAFLDAGVPVALGTDNPVQFGTSIDREYGQAAQLGLSAGELSDLTRNGVRAAFTSQQRRDALMALVDGSERASRLA